MKKKNRLIEFLFGKDTEIFNQEGHVEHKLPESWWIDWEDRFKEPEFLWKNHRGMNPIEKTVKNKKTINFIKKR